MIASVKAFVPKRARQLLRATYGKGRARSQDCDAPHALMKLPGFRFCPPISVGLTAVLLALPAVAATLHVWQESPSPAPPYADWATAAHVIQDAVDAAQAGDTVLVTNGVYATGGCELPYTGYGAVLNRVAVIRPIVLLSVNGPAATEIRAGSRTRGAFLADGAVLSGFTVTGGRTQSEADYGEGGAGVWCGAGAVVTNCVLTGNTAWAYGGGAYGGTLYDCTLANNWAAEGGGAYQCTLYRCTLTGNVATGVGGGVREGKLYSCTLDGNQAGSGGGAALSDLYNCRVTRNTAQYSGGGTEWGTLSNCILSGNSAGGGGGAGRGTLYNCTVTANSARSGGGVYGGGACECQLYNCLLDANSARSGGGAFGGSLRHCTVTGNDAGGDLYGSLGVGGGVWGATLDNCVVWDNVATGGNVNHWRSVISFSCTTPLPEGDGNLTNGPAFVNAAAGDYRLRPDSPCIDAGTNLTAVLTNDLVGLPRPLDGNGDGVAAFDMGAYEFNPYHLAPALPAGGSGLQLSLQTEPGRVVRIERSRDLIHWEPWLLFESPVSALDLFDPTASDPPVQFYRTIREP